MNIVLEPELEAALNESARRHGLSPESIVRKVLREQFLSPPHFERRDEWERRLLELASNCGTAPSNEALGREEIYE